MSIYIRWMIRRDFPAALAIDAIGNDDPLSEEDLVSCLRERNVIGMVAEQEGTILGYIIYELHERFLTIRRLGIDRCLPVTKQSRVLSAILRKLAWKLSAPRRNHIIFDVDERDLELCLALKSRGWYCYAVTRRPDESDLLRFRFNWSEVSEFALPAIGGEKGGP